MRTLICRAAISPMALLWLSMVIAWSCWCPSEIRAVDWKSALRQRPEWYGSKEASRIADNLLEYQCDIGGWPKNIEMGAILDDEAKAAIRDQKADTNATIDNGATVTQLNYLARVHAAQKLERHRTALLKGVEYLLKMQYANGGWPQYYPKLTGYYKHITFNDDAMIGVMRLLRAIGAGQTEYAFAEGATRKRSADAVAKGVDCILKTQIVIEGQKTVWCAQHDEVTLLPASGRTYELVSLSGSESVGIVRFLMSIEAPSPEVIDAIESAVAWFEKSKLMGISWVTKPDSTMQRGYDRVVVHDAQAGPLWARFYEIGTNRPIFVGRDGIVKYSVAEIEDERRNGYAWYTSSAAGLLSKDYPNWRQEQNLP